MTRKEYSRNSRVINRTRNSQRTRVMFVCFIEVTKSKIASKFYCRVAKIRLTECRRRRKLDLKPTASINEQNAPCHSVIACHHRVCFQEESFHFKEDLFSIIQKGPVYYLQANVFLNSPSTNEGREQGRTFAEDLVKFDKSPTAFQPLTFNLQ